MQGVEHFSCQSYCSTACQPIRARKDGLESGLDRLRRVQHQQGTDSGIKYQCQLTDVCVDFTPILRQFLDPDRIPVPRTHSRLVAGRVFKLPADMPAQGSCPRDTGDVSLRHEDLTPAARASPGLFPHDGVSHCLTGRHRLSTQASPHICPVMSRITSSPHLVIGRAVRGAGGGMATRR